MTEEEIAKLQADLKLARDEREEAWRAQLRIADSRDSWRRKARRWERRFDRLLAALASGLKAECMKVELMLKETPRQTEVWNTMMTELVAIRRRGATVVRWSFSREAIPLPDGGPLPMKVPSDTLIVQAEIHDPVGAGKP